VTRRAFLATPAAFARSWEQRAFPEWSAEFIDRMLTDSPWAKPVTTPFRFKSRQLPNGVATEFYLTVRWTSALPIRQALALLEHGRNGLDQPRAVELLASQPRDYVIDIGGFNTLMYPQGAAKLRDELARSVRVLVKGRHPLKPVDVEVPDHGMHLSASLRLPRYEGLGQEDGVIEVTGETLGAGIDCKFKLREMVYRGALEL
jgi:hypothetical protein